MKGCVNVNNSEILKSYILEKYNSVREFTIKMGIPYTTIHSIFKRGVNNSSVSNINKICSALEIDIRDLTINNKITTTDKLKLLNINESLEITKNTLLYGFKLSNGDKLTKKEVEEIIEIFNNVFKDMNDNNS